jgi:hypothetical protein
MPSSAHHARWIRKEAAMAAIAFNPARRAGRVERRFKAVLTLVREMLDAFVSRRMRRAAAEAAPARRRQSRATSSQPKDAVIAMQLTGSDFSRRQAPGDADAVVEQDSERDGGLNRPATVPAQFQPLDPGVLNEAIPAFFIGRNKEGFWVARDVNGRIGGIFLLENSALSFARHSEPKGCATIYPSERFELDLENRGNPLAARFGAWMRLAKRLRRRVVAVAAELTAALKRGLNDFHVR